jgi:hypothetical protein
MMLMNQRHLVRGLVGTAGRRALSASATPSSSAGAATAAGRDFEYFDNLEVKDGVLVGNTHQMHTFSSIN